MLQNRICRLPGWLSILMRMGNPDHILVVDDDRELRELLERYLAGSGYRITTVANGRRCARCSPATALI